MKKFNRLLCVIISLVFIGVTLAGCALFQQDDSYYYNQIVARVGSDITITKRQLVNAFNSFGYQYVSQSGMSLSSAYDQTLSTLVDREIAVRISVELYGDGGSASTGKLKIYMPGATTADKMVTAATESEAKDARKTAFDYVESQVRTYETQVRKEKNWPDDNPDTANADSGNTSSSTDSSSSSTSPAVYTPFAKYIDYAYGNYTLNLDKYKDDTTSTGFVPATNEDFITQIKLPRGSNDPLEQSIITDAYNRYVRNLQNSQKGMGFRYTTDAEKDEAVSAELTRIEIESEKNSIVNRLQDAYNLGVSGKDILLPDDNTVLETLDGLGISYSPESIPSDEGDEPQTYTISFNALEDLKTLNFPVFERIVQNNNQSYVNGLVETARASFRYKVAGACSRYEQGFDSDSTYVSSLLDSLSSTYFAPNTIAGQPFVNQFFTVSQVLISYTDDQKSQLTAINDKYNQDKNKENRDNAIALLRSQVTVVPNIDGTKTGDPMTAAQVLDEIKNYVGPFNQSGLLQDKVKKFRDMIYKFNDDPGMLNPSFEYVIGIDKRTDKSDNSTETDNMSRMVPEFTAAARKLYNYNYDTNQGGYMTEADYVNTFPVNSNIFNDFAHNQDKLVSTLGTISDITWTDYGAEILMYTRNISDFIFTNTAALLDSQLDTFLNATQTSYGNKTYFDAEIDAITKPQYSDYESGLLDNFKGETDSKDKLINVIKLYKSVYKDLTKSS